MTSVWRVPGLRWHLNTQEESEDSSCVLFVTKMRTARQCQEVPQKDPNLGTAGWPRVPRRETELFQHHGDILQDSDYHERVLVKRKHPSTMSFLSELFLSQTHLSLLNSVCFQLKKAILNSLLSRLRLLCPSLRIFLQWKRKQLSKQIHIDLNNGTFLDQS